MNIRQGTREDNAKVSEYVKDLWMMHANQDPDFYNLKVFQEASPEKYYESIDGKNSLLLIAEDEDKLAGFLKLDVKEIERFFVSKEVLYADEIYVIEQYRDKGVGKMLLEEAEKIAKTRKIKLMKARVYAFNEKAQKLMEKQGYKGLYSEYYKIVK